MSNLIDFTKRFGESLSQKVKLSNYSWFNLGGNAEFFFKPKDKTELLEFFKEAKKNDIKTTFLGAGSNTLFRDNGVKGAVIKLGKNFSFTRLIGKDIIEVGAGTLDRKVADFAKENNLTNLEFLSCIPGSIGGAIIMNSGCYGHDISKVLVSINIIDIDTCQEQEIKQKDIDFLKEKISLTRWPDEINDEKWSLGTGLTYLQELMDYWVNQYDWSKAELALNEAGSFKFKTSSGLIQLLSGSL